MANFTQIIENTTIGPGAVFPENCYFKNVTILAQCKFGKGCIFENCTFQKCCPKPYSNPNSEVTESIIKNSYLEYVTVDERSLLDNNQKGDRAIILAKENPAGQATGATDGKNITWYHGCPTDEVPCPPLGVVISAPTGSGEPLVNPLYQAGCDCENTNSSPDGSGVVVTGAIGAMIIGGVTKIDGFGPSGSGSSGSGSTDGGLSADSELINR